MALSGAISCVILVTLAATTVLDFTIIICPTNGIQAADQSLHASSEVLCVTDVLDPAKTQFVLFNKMLEHRRSFADQRILELYQHGQL